MHKIFTLCAFLMAGLMTFTACKKEDNAPSNIINLTAKLDGNQEVPAIMVAGTGNFTGTFDKETSVLTYEITYQGLTAAPTMGHIHMGAVGTNGNPFVSFNPVAVSPIKGTATLSESSAAEIMAGTSYVNIHTSQHRGGEIRGQIMIK